MIVSNRKVCRIGCGSGFWGDSPDGAGQLIDEHLNFLVFDYLAEITMALLAANKRRNPQHGYVPDFLDYVIRPHAAALTSGGIRVVANAGGMNVRACRDAILSALRDAGVELKVATVEGDDLMDRAATLAGSPPDLLSLNAYLGAGPIVRALDMGADIVVTGRCVDSALVLGPLVHWFGWSWADFDRLSQGSLAGHLLECGCQVTGGILTDWQTVPGWDCMGYPIAECSSDGEFVVTKPKATGGVVNRATVAEQIVYEVGDPAAYALPDVVCDWGNVRIEECGVDRVRVSGARGRAPSGKLKASAVVQDGFKISGELTIAGPDARPKALRTAEAILTRTRRMMGERDFPDYEETLIEPLGAECLYGAHARSLSTREIVLRVSARHRQRDALEIFSREFLASATSMAQGITGFAGGRPKPRPVLRHSAVYVDADDVEAIVSVDGATVVVPNVPWDRPPMPEHIAQLPEGAQLGPETPYTVPLIALAFGRSGDKGDTANIGIVARRDEYMPALRAALTEDAVARWFAHLVIGPVRRYDWPGLPGFNFVLEGALGGGGSASLRQDPQGKTYAQLLMHMPVGVTKEMQSALGAERS